MNGHFTQKTKKIMNVHTGLGLPPQDHCPHSSSLQLHHHHHLHRSAKPPRDLSAVEQQELRRRINSRERRRMQDLNMAMDALREVMVPYVSNPTSSHTPGRRLSKISTLLLARNYILLLGSSLQEMRRLLAEMGSSSAPVPRLLLTGAWPGVSSPQILLTQESFIAQPSSSSNGKCPVMAPPSGLAVEAMLVPGQWGGVGGNPCPCGVCRLPRFNHATTRFTK